MKLLSGLLRPSIAPVIALFLFGASSHCLPAQKPAHVVMLSDIHYNPFQDPGKVALLRTAPIARWAKILAAPATPTQKADDAQLRATCGIGDGDTSYVLLNSTIYAMHNLQPTPAFITVSGDVMAEKSECRFHTLFPTATAAEYSAFAAKTIEFVDYSIWLAYRNTAIYMALGNSDSSCQDNREDPGSPFLESARLRSAATTYTWNNRFAILGHAAKYGDYSVNLPGPMRKTRLIVLQDVYQSRQYRTCSGATQPAGGPSPLFAQNDWLHLQLVAARRAHQKVWIMAHLPPGIDTQSLVDKSVDVCSIAKDGTQAPADTFLATEFLANNLDQFSNIIKLSIFGHTQRDELRLFKGAKGSAVPGKLLPSVSPNDGNSPAFTIATVNTSTATVQDYSVIAATGDIPTVLAKPTPWAVEYTYSAVYKLPDLSGASVQKLTANLLDDRSGTSQFAADYRHYFFVSDPFGTPNALAAAHSATMKRAWPTYACSIAEVHSAAFRSCVCPVKATVATADKAPLQP